MANDYESLLATVIQYERDLRVTMSAAEGLRQEHLKLKQAHSEMRSHATELQEALEMSKKQNLYLTAELERVQRESEERHRQLYSQLCAKKKDFEELHRQIVEGRDKDSVSAAVMARDAARISELESDLSLLRDKMVQVEKTRAEVTRQKETLRAELEGEREERKNDEAAIRGKHRREMEDLHHKIRQMQVELDKQGDQSARLTEALKEVEKSKVARGAIREEMERMAAEQEQFKADKRKELDGTLESLAKQRAEGLRLRQQLAETERRAEHFATEAARLSTQVEETSGRLSDAEQAMTVRLGGLERRYSLEVAELQAKVEEERGSAALAETKHRQRVSNLRAEIAVISEKLKESQQRSVERETSLSRQLEEERRSAAEKITELQTQRCDLEERGAALRAGFAEKEAELVRQLELSRREEDSLRVQVAESRASLDRTECEREAARSEERRLGAELRVNQADYSQLQEQHRTLMLQVEQNTARAENAEAETQELQKQLLDVTLALDRERSLKAEEIGRIQQEKNFALEKMRVECDDSTRRAEDLSRDAADSRRNMKDLGKRCARKIKELRAARQVLQQKLDKASNDKATLQRVTEYARNLESRLRESERSWDRGGMYRGGIGAGGGGWAESLGIPLSGNVALAAASGGLGSLSPPPGGWSASVGGGLGEGGAAGGTESLADVRKRLEAQAERFGVRVDSSALEDAQTREGLRRGRRDWDSAAAAVAGEGGGELDGSGL